MRFLEFGSHPISLSHLLLLGPPRKENLLILTPNLKSSSLTEAELGEVGCPLSGFRKEQGWWWALEGTLGGVTPIISICPQANPPGHTLNECTAHLPRPMLPRNCRATPQPGFGGVGVGGVQLEEGG